MPHSPDSILIALKFLKWIPLYEVEKPFQIFINIPEDASDKRTTNLTFQDIEVQVKNVRQYPPRHFQLDTHGFKYCSHKFQDFYAIDRESIEQRYLPMMESLLRSNLEHVDRVFFFDWRLRKNAPEIEGTLLDLNDLTTWLRPALHLHVGAWNAGRQEKSYTDILQTDQSPLAVIRRILMQFPEDAESLLKGRIRVINLWRPIIDSVQDYPLAICDGSTVLPSDLVEADHIRRHYTGSTMYLKHDQRQKFYYMSRQTKDEVLIFKNFDSANTPSAICAPHASFLDPNIPKSFTPRQSIEARALVFTNPAEATAYKSG